MTLYALSALILCVVSVFLIFHCQYEDGVFGRIALVALAITNGVTVSQCLIDGVQFDLLPATVANQCAMAAFLVRHCYRFIRWSKCGDYQWRPARK